MVFFCANPLFRQNPFSKPLIERGCLLLLLWGVCWAQAPPDPTLESASPSPPQGSIWHRFNIDSTLMRHWFDIDFLISLFWCRISMSNRYWIDATLTPEEGRARRIWGWVLGGLRLMNSQFHLQLEFFCLQLSLLAYSQFRCLDALSLYKQEKPQL